MKNYMQKYYAYREHRSSQKIRMGIYVSVLMAVVHILHAQDVARPTGTIEGRVINASTQEPVPGATIIAIGTKAGAVSNQQGRFVMKNVPVGVYTLRGTALGFRPFLRADVTVSSGKPYLIEIGLEETTVKLQEVEANASYFRKSTETITSTNLLNAEDVRRAPGVQEDIVRAVSLLPGVSATPGGRNDLIVRGGAPFENLFLVDNIEVPNINHFGSQGSSGGPLSIINIDFVKEVSFSTGGFGAKYGDRVSSVTNITLRDGSEEAFSGEVNLSATGFGVILEGPIAKNSSFLFSARRSYLDLIFKAAGFGFVPEYWDFTGKISWELDSKNSLSFLTIGALGSVSFNNSTAEQRVNNTRILAPSQNQYFSGITWKHLFGTGFMNVTLGRTFSRYESAQRDFRDSANPVTLLSNLSREGETSLRADVVLLPRKDIEISFGSISKYASLIDYDVTVSGQFRRDANNVPRPLRVDTNFAALRTALYGQVSYQASENFKITPGLRADYYAFLEDGFRVSPRLAMSYALNPISSLNFSAGRYYQSPQYIWMIGDARNGRTLKPFRADQAVLGYEIIPATDIKFTIETYYKHYADYPARVFRPQGVLAPTSFDDLTLDIPFGLEPVTPIGTGRAYGIEFFVQKKLSEIPLYGLASISINRTAFTSIEGVERTGTYDSRILGNIAVGYRFNEKWEVSAKMRLATGLPTTPFYARGSNREGQLDFTRLNEGERLPALFAIDVRVDRRWSFSGLQLVTYIDIQNINARKNVSGIRWDFVAREAVQNSSIGVLPSIGVNIEF